MITRLMLGAVFVGVCTWLISRVVSRLWLRSETKKAEAQARRLKGLQAAIELVQILERERGRTPPAAPGYPHRRVG